MVASSPVSGAHVVALAAAECGGVGSFLGMVVAVGAAAAVSVVLTAWGWA